jgi:hypothetical protein
MKHAFLACANTSSIDLVDREVGDVVEFDEVGVPQDIVFVLEVVFGGWVEGSSDGRCVCKLGRSSELPPSPGVLVKLCHIFITYLNLNPNIKSFEFSSSLKYSK